MQSKKFDRLIAQSGYLGIGGMIAIPIFGIFPHYAESDTLFIYLLLCCGLFLSWFVPGMWLFSGKEKNVFVYFHISKNSYIRALHNALGILSLVCLLWFNFRNWELSDAYAELNWKHSIIAFVDNIFTSLPLYVGWLVLKIRED